MENKPTLILNTVLLLALAACGGTSENGVPRSEPSESNSIYQIEAMPDPGATPDNDSPYELIQSDGGENSVTNISITIGSSVFTARLYDNETAKEFAARLPISLNMSELNGNEKFYSLPEPLPADSERVGNINAGNLMLYGSDCLVLFYEDFSTSYNYTRLGTIEDASGLAASLGSGSVEVSFAVKE